ncbi:MAG: MlaD family protein [Actinomycetota bacterium]|nr:MlaD family protein [Actinomycetota bacterium]
MAGGRDPRDPGMSPLKAGLLAGIVILVFSFFGFSRHNPFSDPYKLTATFQSANNLQPKSPVRVAGIDVGKVTKVEPLPGGTGAARVEMEIQKKGLPIHEDAQLKIRPRIFLEGNFFVDLQQGTPDAPVMEDEGKIPVQQTATPVQFGQLLTALQRDTRSDLQTFFKEYAREGLGNGGAEAYNRSLTHAPEALRNASIANEASLGERPHDLSRLLRGQQRLSEALTASPEQLKDLITNLNLTAEAFGRNDAALRATVPALRDVLRVGQPALVSLNDALPTLRAFARDATPGVRSSGPTIDASMPFIRQARLLVRREELRGLAADLRRAIPDLARVNRDTIPLLDNQRALSACTSEVLVPFAQTPINDPDFAGRDPDASGQPFYKQAPRGLVGLAGESRINDANTPMFHVQFSSGPANLLVYNEAGEQTFAGVSSPPEGVRPARPSKRPVFRPGIPCETQEPPDLNAPGGPPDQMFGPTGNLLPSTIPPGLLPPLPKRIANAPREQQLQLAWIQEWARRKAAGKSTPDPMAFSVKSYPRELRKAGLATTSRGKIYERGDEKAKEKADAEDQGAVR